MLNVQILGRPEVGKSCFIAGMAWLAGYPKGSFTVHPNDDATKKHFSELREQLENGRWPEKTSHSTPFSFTIAKANAQPLEVKMEDCAGEDFIDALVKGTTTDASKHIQQRLQTADLVLIFLDSSELSQNDLANSGLLQAVFERNKNEKSAPGSVAVVLTKIDRIEDPRGRTEQALIKLVKKELPLFVQQLEAFAKKVTWLPVSIVDSDSRPSESMQLPAIRFNPTGYEKVIDTFERVSSHRSRFIIKITIALLALLLASIGAWYLLEKQFESFDLRLINNEKVAVRDLPPPRSSTQQAYTNRLLDQLRQSQNDIDESSNRAGIEETIRSIDRWSEAQQELVKEEISQLKKQASDRQELLLLRQLKEAIANEDQFATLYKEYMLLFPNGKYLSQIKSLRGDIHQNEMIMRKNRIASIAVKDLATLQRRIDEVSSYVNEFQTDIDPVERDRMELAIAKGRAMLNEQTYHITLVKTAGFDGPRDHQVVVSVNEKRLLFKDSGDVAEKNWNERFEVPWRAGQNVRVTIQNLDYRTFLAPNDIAFFEGPTPLQILCLAEPQSRPTRYENGFDQTSMKLSLTMKCDELDQEAIQAIRNYLFPGTRW